MTTWRGAVAPPQSIFPSRVFALLSPLRGSKTLEAYQAVLVQKAERSQNALLHLPSRDARSMATQGESVSLGRRAVSRASRRATSAAAAAAATVSETIGFGS